MGFIKTLSVYAEIYLKNEKTSSGAAAPELAEKGKHVFAYTSAIDIIRVRNTIAEMDTSLMRMLIAGPDVSLNGVADRVADDGRFVLFAALAAEVAGFNMLFGIVPGAACVGEHDGEDKAGDRGTEQHAGHARIRRGRIRR